MNNASNEVVDTRSDFKGRLLVFIAFPGGTLQGNSYTFPESVDLLRSVGNSLDGV